MRSFCLHSSQDVVQNPVSYLAVLALAEDYSHGEIYEKQGDLVWVPDQVDNEGNKLFLQIFI